MHAQTSSRNPDSASAPGCCFDFLFFSVAGAHGNCQRPGGWAGRDRPRHGCRGRAHGWVYGVSRPAHRPATMLANGANRGAAPFADQSNNASIAANPALARSFLRAASATGSAPSRWISSAGSHRRTGSASAARARRTCASACCNSSTAGSWRG
jgi:hypothetical protein